MRHFDTRRHDLDTLRAVFARRAEPGGRDVEEAVRAIVDDVRARGDVALLYYTRLWDCPEAGALRVDEAEIAAAVARVEPTPLWPALLLAAERIRRFHEPQRRQSWMDVARPGELLGQIVRPLASAGVYAPGGTAAYPSTVLMAAVPAQVAGVERIVVATPPGREGRVPDATLAAAHVAGVHAVYAVGGAQAIAALAYGTQTVERVDKVVGPGNRYVNAAKRLVFGAVGIDMLAGPSEVLVLADEHADPEAAAADIVAQAEHDADCAAVVVTPSEAFAQAVVEQIETQTATLPRREIVARALESAGFVVRTRTLEEAAEVASVFAPEHLHLLVRDPWALLPLLKNAGAVLIGSHTSAPLGDYLAGPSHTLPTAGCARFASPLHVDDFTKKTSLIHLSEAAAAALEEAAAAFADGEGLSAHARAARRGGRRPDH